MTYTLVQTQKLIVRATGGTSVTDTLLLGVDTVPSSHFGQPSYHDDTVTLHRAFHENISISPSLGGPSLGGIGAPDTASRPQVVGMLTGAMVGMCSSCHFRCLADDPYDSLCLYLPFSVPSILYHP